MEHCIAGTDGWNIADGLEVENVCVDASCCAGVTLESHLAALTAMRMCQVEVVA